MFFSTNRLKFQSYGILILLLVIGILITSISAQAAVTVPTGQALVVSDSFTSNSSSWQLYGDAQLQTDGTMQLTSPSTNKAGVIWLKQPLAPPFTVSFRYQILSSGSPADGLVFMFNKRKSEALVPGGGMGFEVGNGYGVEFDTWSNGWDPSRSHITLFKDNPETKLKQVEDTTIANGSWHTVTIEVTATNVKTYMDYNSDGSPKLKLNWSGSLSNTYSDIGFAASTGSSYSRHLIDDVVITRPLSSNGNLSSLTMEGQSIPFQPGTPSYQLKVPYETSVAHLHFTTEDSRASVTSVTSSVTSAVYGVTATGANVPLDVGPNTIGITVRAEDDSTRTYSVKVTRTGSSNAFLNDIIPASGEVLSPQFQSGTFLYELYVPSTQEVAHVQISLSDGNATYSVTGSTYGGGTWSQAPSLIPGGPIQLYLSTQQSWYDLKVTAEDGQTFRTYRIQPRKVQNEDHVGFARMIDATTLEVAFTTPAQLPSTPSLSAFHLSGTSASVIQVSSVPASYADDMRIRLKLSQPIGAGENVKLSLLPGALQLPNNQPLLQLNAPILTLSRLDALSVQLDSMEDGVHIDDVVRFMNSHSQADKDLNSNDRFDKFDVQVLLGLIH